MRVYRELCADLTFIIDAQVQTGCSTWCCPLKREKTLQVPENCLGCGKFLALADGQLPDCCDPKKRTTASADSSDTTSSPPVCSSEISEIQKKKKIERKG